MCDPVILAVSAMAVGGTMSAVGEYNQGHAAAQAAKYNSAMADQNAKINDANTEIAGQSGQAQVAQQQRSTRALVGDTLANQGASGVEVNKGSSVDVRGSESSLGYLDAMNIRTNATREAYGYLTQAENQRAESKREAYKAKKTEQGALIGSIGSFLGTVGSAGTSFAKYKSSSGIA